MAELSADIIVNAQNAQRNINRTIRSVDGLEKEFLQAGAAADRLSAQTARVGRSTSQTTQIFFQAGQAISDFAVAGIRGAANNLEFLALQMGVGGPLILAITAATTAFVVFQKDIEAAIGSSRQELKELAEGVKEVSDSIIKLSKDTKITFSGSLNQLEDDASRVTEIVGELEKQAKSLRLELGKERTQTLGGVTTFVATSDEIKEIQGDLESVNNVLTRQKSILESLNETIEEEKLLQQVIADLEGTSLERKEEEVKKEKEKLSIIEKIEKKNKDLRAELDILQSIDQIRLGTLIEQNRVLGEQVKNIQEQARIAAFLSQIDIRQSPGASPFEQTDEFSSLGGGPTDALSDLDVLIEKLKFINVATFEVSARFSQFVEAIGMDLDDLSDKQITSLSRIIDNSDLSIEALSRMAAATSENSSFMSAAWINAIERMISQAKILEEVIESGLGNAIASLASSVADGDPFTALRKSIGDFAQDLGKTLIGFGLAGIAIDQFIKNPATALIAGSALVALGAALKKSAEGKAADFSSGSAGAEAPQVPGFIDPRQGRTGRFQRDTAELNEARVPGSLQIDIFGEFNLSGRDLTASVERTQQTQRRTRGPRG